MNLELFSGKVKAVRARSIATRTKTIMRRAKSEAVLREVLPAVPEMGMSYHVISHGDVDALSYLAHCVRAWPLDWCLVSTWCMAMPDVQTILGWLDSGRIGGMCFCIGEIFPTQYPDEFTLLDRLAGRGELELKVARNHAKIILGAAEHDGIAFAIESSANVNTNPRIEQTALHMSQDLFEFYRDFYADVRSIHRRAAA